MDLKRGMAAAVALPLAAALALSGCADSSERSAAAASDLASQSLPSPEGSEVAGLYRDSQVCIINDSSIPLSVKFTKMDRSSGGGVLAPKSGEAGQACASGWFSGYEDVVGDITSSSPDQLWEFAANNTRGASPTLYVSVVPDGVICHGGSYDQGSEGSFDDGVTLLTTRRLPDTPANIEFRMVFADSPNPNADGKPSYPQGCL